MRKICLVLKRLPISNDDPFHRSYLNLSPPSAQWRTNATRVTLLGGNNIRHSSRIPLREFETGGFLKLRHISSLSLPSSIFM